MSCLPSSEGVGLTLTALLVRWLISLNPHSGAGKPPMFGDFEAQRHWMEITYNLPVKQWYTNSTDNDLMYWGLDYPPLTAYHSWLCGLVSSRVNSSWVELGESRGLEDSEHKLFMRLTVLIADFIVFFPAVCAYFETCCKDEGKQKMSLILLTLLYPGLMLIDHGHFQYNCISLGLFLWAVVFILQDRDCLGAAMFVLALNYKQMELYHAMPFFFYLLGVCFKGKQFWFWKLTKIGLTVILVFALCWLPFLSDASTAGQVLHRLFPFARGLYEDKVANVWCSLSLIIKLKNFVSIEALIKTCLVSTLVMLLPSSFHLLLNPTKSNFRYSLVNCSLAFFLFSFQVHEKSILIPAVSVCLLLPQSPFVAVWFLLISTFSMWPLLVKDSLIIPCGASMVVFFLTALVTHDDSTDSTSSSPTHRKAAKTVKNDQKPQSKFWLSTPITVLFSLSLLGAVVLSVTSLTVRPPRHLPDIFPVLISVYSCAHFGMFFAYFNLKQFGY